MREFRNFACLLGIILTIFSCQTDSFEEEFIQTDENISVNNSVTSRAVTDCGFIPELCTRPFIPVAQHEPAILTPCCDSIVGGSEPVQSLVFKNGNDLYRVYTLDLFDNSIDYVVVDQNQEIFFLLNTQDEYLSGHSKEIALPIGLNLVASLNYTSLRDGNLTLSEATTSVGNKANVTSSHGEVLIDITNTINDDVQALVRYDWCKYVIPSTIRKYKNELMSSYEIIEGDYRLDNAIEEAVLNCTPDLCLDCADSKCVLDAILDHPQLFPIPNSTEVKTDIKINYLKLLLDLTDDQIDWLKNNPTILDDLFDTYDLNFRGTGQVESRSIGCDLNICGAEGAANAHINLLMNGINLTEEEAENLCNFYTYLFELSKSSYNCLVSEGELVAQMSIAEFGSTAPIYAILNENGLENTCQPFGKYVPCSEVIFSNPQPPTNQRICQIEINMAINTLLCIPPVPESEGVLQNLDMSIKVEFRIPDFAFSGVFGYENNQTIVAILLSDAVQYAWNLVKTDISCSNAVSKKGDFINHFFSYIQDVDVLTENQYWGQTGFSVEVFKNFQIFVPDYEETSTELFWSESVTKCN